MYTADVDLTLTAQNRAGMDLYATNSRLGRPDFRPDLYAKMYATLADDYHWASLMTKASD